MTDSAENKPAADSAKILDDIAKVKPAAKTRAQRRARSRVLILVFLLLPLLGGLVWLAWQQWLLQAGLPELTSRLELVEQQSVAPTASALSSEQLAQVNELIAEARANFDAQLQAIRSEQGAEQTTDPALERRLTQRAAEVASTALSQLDTRVAAQQGAVDGELDQLRQQFAQLAATVRANATNPSAEWRLLEAEYLLAMAVRKLRYEQDVTAAGELYELADSALVNSGSPDIYPLRQSLARELASLRAVELPDTDSLFLRLDILLAQAETLVGAAAPAQLRRQEYEQRREVVSSAASATQSEWSMTALTTDTLEFLRSVFVWRETSEPAQQVFAVGSEGAQRWVLILEQAKLALLAKDSLLFSRLVNTAEQWLTAQSGVDESQREAAMAELSALRGVELNPALPPVGETLLAVQQLNASSAL
jgi:uroporphyrin-3 C-methyltransferase